MEANNKEHILLALCGMSPAVISETIYVLNQSNNCPDSLVVITTTAGKKVLQREFFDSGVWQKLLQNIDKKISFSLNHKHCRILPAEDGNAPDITNTADVENAADFILETLRQFTENPETRITFSIAGGRKSMTASAALCMSLLGRTEDQLCHVLVTPPFEDPRLQPKFYFPCPETIHKTPDGNSIPASTAQLQLSFLPYVRCRYLIQNELQRLPGNYEKIVLAATNKAEAISKPKKLIIDLMQETVIIGDTKIKLQFFSFMLYWMLAERAQKRQKKLHGSLELYENFIDFIEEKTQLVEEGRFYYNCVKLLNSDIDSSNLARRIYDLKKALQKYRISENFLPCRKRAVYALNINADQIILRIS